MLCHSHNGCVMPCGVAVAVVVLHGGVVVVVVTPCVVSWASHCIVSQASHCMWYHSYSCCAVWCCGRGGCRCAMWDCSDWTTKEEISRKKRKEKKKNASEGKLARVAWQCSPCIIAIDMSLWSVVGPWCTLGVCNWAKEEVSKKRKKEEMYQQCTCRRVSRCMVQMQQATGMLHDLAKKKLNSGQIKHNSTRLSTVELQTSIFNISSHLFSFNSLFFGSFRLEEVNVKVCGLFHAESNLLTPFHLCLCARCSHLTPCPLHMLLAVPLSPCIHHLAVALACCTRHLALPKSLHAPHHRASHRHTCHLAMPITATHAAHLAATMTMTAATTPPTM